MNHSKFKFSLPAAILFIAAVGVLITTGILVRHAGSPKLPSAAAALAGYTNVHLAEPGWPEGWHALIVVTNLLTCRIDCIVGSYPRFVSDAPVWPTIPGERDVDPHSLPQTVAWAAVPNPAQPEVYMPGDVTVGQRLGRQITLKPGENASFSVKLWPTNATLVQVQYRVPTSQPQKWRLALAKELNIMQSRLLRRRVVNLRTWDDRAYHAFTTLFSPTVTNLEPTQTENPGNHK